MENCCETGQAHFTTLVKEHVKFMKLRLLLEKKG